MATQRRIILFRGRVQGVGFRESTRRLASGMAVSGTVRNLRDGGVEVVAEGEPAEIDRLVAAILGRFTAEVSGVSSEDRPPADPPTSGFEILR